MKNIFKLVYISFLDFFNIKNKNKSNNEHLRNAIKWLTMAQDSTKDSGVSEGFHLYHGWLLSYPETTGYIIETFFDYYNKTNNIEYKNRAVKMTDWLISIQDDSGAIPDSYFKKVMVFDTGQVLFGLVRTFKETDDIKYKNAAIKAGDWLLKVQEEDGSWKKYAVDQIPHTYYSRVAWSLLKLHSICNEDKYKSACIKNIEWTILQQKENGWFDKASFNEKNHHQPFTHTIAYTIRGVLEAGLYLENEKYIESAKKAMDGILIQIKGNGFISGVFDKNWEEILSFNCLTGSAQLAIIFFKLYEHKKINKYFEMGKLINIYLKNHQELRVKDKTIYGAIAGSKPIWGKYIHFTYPNWAIKFFIDSLMLEMTLVREKIDY